MAIADVTEWVGQPPWLSGAIRRRGPAVVAVAAAAVLILAVTALLQRDGAEDLLLVRGDDGTISLVDPGSGSRRASVADAVPTHDRSALLTTRMDGGRTVLESRDPRTGAITGSTTLDGALRVRTVSPRGRAVALMAGGAGEGLYEPVPRDRTELAVAFLDARPPLRFDLPANVEPEMFSLDERALFVLEFTPPTDPSSYEVRLLDLATGELSDTDKLQVELNPRMRGKARAQVLHPQGTHLFTLYTLPGDAPVHDVEAPAETERWAFVHVISLEHKWSHCIFLPVPFGTTDEATIGLGIAPDGESVFVADPAVSQMARIDVDAFEVAEVFPVEQLRPTGARAAVAVADDGTVYAAAGNVVVELAPGSLEPVHAWASRGRAAVSGLQVAGDELRVAGNGRVTLVDRATRRETGVIDLPGRGTVELLGPPRGSVVEFPLECAC